MREIKRKLAALKDFFADNFHWRKIRVIFYYYISRFRRLLLAFLLITVTIFFVVYLFKPSAVESFYNRALSFVLRNISFKGYNLNRINVSGNNRVSKDEVVKIVKEAREEYLQGNNDDYRVLIQNIIDDLKSQIPWINNLVVSRTVPDVINVAITEYEPFAIWHNNGKKYIIDKDGNTVVLQDFTEFNGLVIISGNGANIHAKSLFNIFAIYPELSAEIYSATWVGNRRFDIRFNSGLLVKLPERNISKSWQRLIEIYKTPGSLIGLQVIDLRIEDKIYLKYQDKINEEIQKL